MAERKAEDATTLTCNFKIKNVTEMYKRYFLIQSLMRQPHQPRTHYYNHITSIASHPPKT